MFYSTANENKSNEEDSTLSLTRPDTDAVEVTPLPLFGASSVNFDAATGKHAISSTPSIPVQTLSPRLQGVVKYAATPLNASAASGAMNHHGAEEWQLDNENYSNMSLEEYIKFMGGNRRISRVLIANNGIAAVKAIRSIRKWAYETFSNDKVIQFVVMATPEDLCANAEYIHLADEFVSVPGGSNNNNYANIHLITEIAENTKCDAVWAGWGHASENPKLPDLLQQTQNKVVWIGPPSHAMRALGDKIGSTLIAQSAGVSCMPWSGDGLIVDYAKTGIPDELYSKSCVDTPEQALTHCERIGFPVMIKASEGGGGKGIRRVERPEDVAFAFRQVQGEVPGSPIFIMKLAGKCRHLEVQLLCDTWGNAVAVFGRDCSIQRRHQKIIEEGPVVAAPPEVWDKMERAAVRLAKEVGYVGAGTVEYLYMDDGEYSFLELNPRLQVEHPVTELISGVNLPAAQLQIAMGIPLHRLPGIRRMYGQSPLTQTPIVFETATKTPLPGHVIACRITAENPDDKFQPTSGVIQELHFRSTPDVWGYFSVGPNGLVHEFADSQFGHLFAVGATRDIARKNMVQALRELEIRGEIRTTIEYLRVILEADDFRNNKISTTWLEKVQANQALSTEKPSQYLAVVCGALFRAHAYAQAQENEYNACLLRGHLPSAKLYSALVKTDLELIYEGTKFNFTVTKSGSTSYDITLVTPASARLSKLQDGSMDASKTSLGSPIPGASSAEVAALESKSTPIRELIASCSIHNLSDGGFLVLINGKKVVMYGREFPSGLRLTIDTMTCLFQQEYDPTQLRADTQGKLVQWLVPSGGHVQKGDAVAEIEVMKMYVTVRAPEAGTITTLKAPGSVIEAGDLMAKFVLDNPECVQKAEVFGGVFTEAANVNNYDSSKVNARLRNAESKLRALLSGYELAPGVLSSALRQLTSCLCDASLPSLQFKELASNVVARIPAALYEQMQALVAQYDASVAVSNNVVFPTRALTSVIENYLANPPSSVVPSVLRTQFDASGITKLLQDYANGNQAHAVAVILSLIEAFLHVEEAFQNAPATTNSVITVEDAIFALRKQYKDDLTVVSSMAKAHHQLVSRANLISSLLDIVWERFSSLVSDDAMRVQWVAYLQRLASLKNKTCATIVLKARQALVSLRLPSQRARLIATLRVLKRVLANRASGASSSTSVDELIDQTQPIEDVILRFLTHSDPSIRKLAAEAYVRRAFHLFSINSFEVMVKPSNIALAGKDEPGVGPAPSLLARWRYYMDNKTTVLDGITGPAALSLENNVSACAAITEARAENGNPLKIASLDVTRGPTPSTPGSSRMLRVDSLSALNKSAPTMRSQNLSSPTIPESDEDEEENNTSGLADGVIERMGVLAHYDTLEQVREGFGTVLSALSTRPKNRNTPKDTPIHVVYVYITSLNIDDTQSVDEVLTKELKSVLENYNYLLSHYGVRRVTFMVGINASISTPAPLCAPTPASLAKHSPDEEAFLSTVVSAPSFITFRAVPSAVGLFEEDKSVRHLEPNNALHLQLDRLANFDYQLVPTTNRMVHLFAAVPKENSSRKPTARPIYDGRRFFARVLVRRLDSVQRSRMFNGKHIIDTETNGEINASVPGSADAHPETEVAFVEALNSLEIAIANATGAGVKDKDANSLLNAPGGNGKWLFNHIFVNVLVDVGVQAQGNDDLSSAALVNVDYVDSIIRSLTRRYADKIRRLHVTNVEFALTLRLTGSNGEATALPVRFLCHNNTGHVLHIDVFYEKYDEASGKVLLVPFKTRAGPQLDLSSLHQYCVNYQPTFPAPGSVYGAGVTPLSSPVNNLVCASFEDADAPYPLSVPHQQQRLTAAAMDTVWCYDFLEIFEKTVRRSWRAYLVALLNAAFQYAVEEAKEKGASTLIALLQILVKYLVSNESSLNTLGENLVHLRQAPLSIFKSAAIALIAANNITAIPADAPNLELIRTLAPLVAQLEGEALRMIAEFAQVAIRIPKVFLSAKELMLVENPAYIPTSSINNLPASSVMSPNDINNNNHAGYSSKYMLKPVDAPLGSNKIAMVAWDVTLYTPECLNFELNLKVQNENLTSRSIVLISNDITIQAGSFGAEEDILFDLASQRARALGVPRIYLAANSGARIGLAEELKGKFKVAFVPGDEDNKAFEYLYFDERTYHEYKNSVACEKVEVDGETRYIITDIVGAKEGLGVENLRGSGCIAGETSRAYEEIFTLTFVTCRTVGIGAYLARLGQRVIQKADPAMPLLLTGFQALNKLLGRPVYSSNVQLGGPDVMYTNGTSHQIVNSDLEGCVNIIKWLSYVPVRRGAAPPLLLRALDPISRSPTFAPASKTALYDPRVLLVGEENAYSAEVTNAQAAPGVPLTGLFDKHSFMEVMGGWAKGIVTGRARLGGIPVGVVCVDPRTTEHTIPADPAGADTKETVITRAGQVWYPESSYKTAQAIFDMAAEDVPLVMLANFRGFSGDSKAMHEMVLKFGSYIVDALRGIKKPIIVYLPPHATLRGGAWVVVDETINYDWMEMYADPTARGGVLEPEGIVDVKFRKEQILAEMHRVDPKMQRLTQELKTTSSEADISLIKAEMKQREKILYPTYLQIATYFADLHDTPVRMVRKGCLRDVVSWSTARERFYWRLRARLAEQDLANKIVTAARDGATLRTIAAQNGITIDQSSPIDATTTASSDITVARALLQQWLNVMSSQSTAHKESQKPALLTAAASNSIAHDKHFVSALSCPHVMRAIEARIAEVSNTADMAAVQSIARGMDKARLQELIATLQSTL